MKTFAFILRGQSSIVNKEKTMISFNVTYLLAETGINNSIYIYFVDKWETLV